MELTAENLAHTSLVRADMIEAILRPVLSKASERMARWSSLSRA
jgi:hypothetical protein